jgi:hypothetical protein
MPMSIRVIRPAAVCVAILCATVIVASALRAGDDDAPPAYKVADKGKVYYGNPDSFSRPAVIASARVWSEIPEYKEILSKKLTGKDPEYWILLDKANRKFFKAISKVAAGKGHDLVAESGAVAGEPAPPNITDEVIKALE